MNCCTVLLAGESFSYCHYVFEETNLPVCCFCGPFLYHVRPCCRRAPDFLLYFRTASTAQHNATTSPSKAAKQVRADRSVRQHKQADREHELYYCRAASAAKHITAHSPHKVAKQVRADQIVTTQASRQSWREPALVVDHVFRTLSSQNDRRNQNLPGLQIYNYYPHNAGVMQEGYFFCFDPNKTTLRFRSVLFLCSWNMHAASGLSYWSMELLALASRQFAPKIVDLSVRFIRCLSERSRRRKPPTGRSAL